MNGHFVSVAFMVSDIVFALARVSTIVLSVVTFVVGFSKYDEPEGEADVGIYNNLLVRLCAFTQVVLLQCHMLFYFIQDHMDQLKEMHIPIRSLLKQQPGQKQVEGPKFSQKKKSKILLSVLWVLPGDLNSTRPRDH